MDKPTHPLLVPHLRQYRHNDGSGLLFGYDKEGIDELVASLARKNLELTRVNEEQRLQEKRLEAALQRALVQRKVLGQGLDGPDIIGPAVCTVPPPGWHCTRRPGHEGPCAAWPDDEP